VPLLLGGRRALVVQTFKATRAIDRVHFRGVAGRFWQKVVFPSIGRGILRCIAYSDDHDFVGAA
jgi:hypothetical protein